MARTLFPLLLLLGCGGAHHDVEHGGETPDAGTTAETEVVATEEVEASDDPRDLGPDATFADLCDVARRLDQLRDQDSAEGCVLTEGYRLSSDLAVAVRPLPVPEEDLDTRMAGNDPVRVLTRYGTYGESGPMGLVAVTTTAPPDQAVAFVVFLTDRGAYSRRTDVAFGAVVPQPIEELVGLLPYHEVATTFVVAEAGLPLETLARFLRQLPTTLAGNVGLAVALESGTVLPSAPATDEVRTAPICDGLPPAPDDATEGTLEAADIVAALGPLRASAAICVGATTGPGARGGRLVLSARIDASGRVTDACISEDSTDDGYLRACVVEAARSLVFPESGGLVDFALPLSVAPGVSHHQRAFCEAS